jgi:hexosaminidase
MTRIKIVLFLSTITTAFWFAPWSASNAQSIIPKPVSMESNDGHFQLHKNTPVFISEDSDEMQFLGSYVANMLYTATWVQQQAKVATTPADTSIFLVLNTKGDFPSPEAYRLVVSPKDIKITASGTAGLFYGIQTLRQLLPAAIEYSDPSLVPNHQTWTIPAVEINDEPRFAYRGLHLDVARHFFPIRFIKKYIDLLAMHKMNRFHWHLTDDQGWRIQIKKYPKLTQVGAWRDSTLIGHYGTDAYDNVRYGGFYTQQQIKEVVQYAQERHITVIPEIEMPGHASAALAAYPELGCFDKLYHVQSTWGVFNDIFCPKEETFDFLENVLLEVMELFPSRYIHIGGDEAPKTQWEESEIAQKVIKREGLKDEHELQSYFVTRIEKFLNAHGRQIIGWDEILEGGLAPKATVMSWRGEAGGIEAAKMHHEVIMTPGGTNYFDHYQANPKTEPVAIGGFTTVEDVYQYEPIPKELTPNEAHYVLGAQGNLWTEYIHSGEKAEYMAYPRAVALAEVLWTPKESKNWLEFRARLQFHFERLDILGVHYAKHYKW